MRRIAGGRVWWASVLLLVAAPACVTGQEAAGDAPSLEPPPVTASGPGTASDLEARVRELEGMVRQMAAMSAAREAEMSERIRQLEGQLAAPSTPAEGGGAGNAGSSASGFRTGGSATSPFGGKEVGRGTIGMATTAKTSSDMPAAVAHFPAKTKFGPGFQIASEDDEYVFQFHNLTQVDGRFYEQGGQMDPHDFFGLPRQWYIFSGRLSKPFEYYVAINQGFDNLNLLDAYLNVHFIDPVQFKVGRYKTPFTYEFYALPVNGLITPERSQFFNNFGLNRNVGLMGWGQLLEKRIDWAAGVFNGGRNGFLDFDNSKDLAAFLNFNPFLNGGVDALEHLNVGGSVDVGNQNEPAIPNRLRLNVPTQGNPTVGVPFAIFEPNVYESGTRALWSAHMTWYYRQLSLIAEWQSGYQYFAFGDTPFKRTKVGTQGYYVQAGYFLTGEEVTARGQLKPFKDFDLRPGRFGIGAWELAGRYEYLNIAPSIFTGGFVDPKLWTNVVTTIDVGVNWYWNQYVKTYIGWQYNAFGNPVLFATDPVNRFQLTSDMFWIRFQIYF
jgi:phosphate-selective porin OprO/OprP